jgi:alkanesulfonate monooxygenase
MSGYPHLEEAYRFAELVFPLLSLRQSDNVTQLRPRSQIGEVIANGHQPLIKASQS